MARNPKIVMKELQNGELPFELDYRKKEPVDIDWSRVFYNTFQKSPEYFESKFPSGMTSIPGFDKYLEQLSDNALTPLQAIELRQNEAKEILLNNENNMKTDSIDE